MVVCLSHVFQVCDVVDRVLKHPVGGQLMKDLHPEFVPPTRPFNRMTYADAITYLREHNITKEDGTFYEFGEVGYLSVLSFYISNTLSHHRNFLVVRRILEIEPLGRRRGRQMRTC